MLFYNIIDIYERADKKMTSVHTIYNGWNMSSQTASNSNNLYRLIFGAW